MTHLIQHIVSVSGGKDSTAVYLRAIELGRPFTAVFADTGNEHQAVYDYIAELPGRTGGPVIQTVRAADLARRLAIKRETVLTKWPLEGIPADVVARAAALHVPTGNTYLDLCVLKGRFPSRMAQFCTEELKTMPITQQVILPALRRGPVIQWLGIRAAESAPRAKQPRANRHMSGSVLWRPIFDWSITDVWDIHRRHGVPRNPLYDAGMTRVGCMPCVNCSKGELRTIAERFPEHVDRIAEWEAIVALVAKRGSATFFAATTDPTDADRPGTYAGIRTVVDWSRTTRGGRQFGMFFAHQSGGGCDNDMALCETGSKVSEETVRAVA